MPSLVLVMSSRYVSPEMQFEVGKIPPALIPINSRPLYSAIREQYRNQDCEFALVVHEGQDLISEALCGCLGTDDEILGIPAVADLGHAICLALKNIELNKYKSIVIHFGDTLVETELNLKQDCIYYDTVAESYRWTTFKIQHNKIESIVDKEQNESLTIASAFCGVFVIQDPNTFLVCLELAVGDSELSLFYSALQSYLKDRQYSLVKVRAWHDFGHVDNYHQARKCYLNTRFFNQLIVDQSRPLVTKTSVAIAKFTDELRWYQSLPEELRCYSPQIFGHQLDQDQASISMEFYGYPTVAELYLNSGHSLGMWPSLLASIFQVAKEMQRFTKELSRAQLERCCTDMYLTKTSARLSEAANNHILDRLMSIELEINGLKYLPLLHYLEALPKASKCLVASAKRMSIIHGDLCISNILYDPRSRIIKLLDPRGRFGELTLYGDSRYDLAKLSHSFNGQFESIVNNRFFLFCEDNKVSLNIRQSDYQRRVSSLFNTKLRQAYPQDLSSIKLIEALLFLSMLPLHADNLDRQIAFLSIGIAQLAECLQSNQETAKEHQQIESQK